MSSANKRRWLWPAAAGALALVGLAGWVAGFWLDPDPRRPWLALVAAFSFFTPIAAGLVVWTAIIEVANGRWAAPLAGRPQAAVWFAPVSILALVVLWIGAGRWAPWAQAVQPQGAWMNPTFVFLRDILSLAAFWALAWNYRRHGGPVRAAFLVATYGVVFSLLGNDLLMGLDPHWASSMFGGYVFISGLYGAVAAWALLAAAGRAPEVRLHDLAKLTFAFCLITTYLMYCHLLPIWYENLPHETRFVIPRLNLEPWRYVSIVLLATIYLGPIVFLLPVRVKRDRRLLIPATIVILLGLLLERFWLVMPVFHPRELRLGLVDLGASALLAGLFALALIRGVRGRSPEASP